MRKFRRKCSFFPDTTRCLPSVCGCGSAVKLKLNVKKWLISERWQNLDNITLGNKNKSDNTVAEICSHFTCLQWNATKRNKEIMSIPHSEACVHSYVNAFAGLYRQHLQDSALPPSTGGASKENGNYTYIAVIYYMKS